MREHETSIRKIVDHLLLNACSVTSSGLYEGKAGMALALFEAAKFLQDQEIEDKAFNLFQESLIRTTNSNDYSFENGLSGIGYTLIYLLTNQFIDADFDNIFKDQSERIIRSFNNIEKSPQNILIFPKVIYFLSNLKSIHQQDVQIQLIIRKILQGIELYLSLQFFDWKDIHYINNKNDVLQVFEIYLKLVCYSNYADFSNYLIRSYADLYRSARITSSLTIGYYLHQIRERSGVSEYNDVIDGNIHFGLKNIHPTLLSFEQSIELAKIIADLPTKYIGSFYISKRYIASVEKSIGYHKQSYGYQKGLSRFLIFSVNKEAVLL